MVSLKKICRKEKKKKNKQNPQNPEIAHKENNKFEKPKKKHCATFTICKKINGTENNHLCLPFNYMQKSKCFPFTLLNHA